MPSRKTNRNVILSALAGFSLTFVACGPQEPVGPPGTPPGNEQNNNNNNNQNQNQNQNQEPAGLPLLGRNTHSTDSVTVTEIANQNSGLNRPRDLGFNPDAPGELWVANERDNSMLIIKATGTPDQTATKKSGFGGNHFMPKPSALAFGKPGFLATVHEQDQKTQIETEADFMGPTLWTSDASFEGGHASHMDMLHNSPNAVGIAWEKDNVYWVFDGYHKSITRYDFASDHGPGGADHSDGIIARYVDGMMSYVKGVGSHMELDHATGLLYIADSGANRITVLDTASGTKGSRISPNYDQGQQYRMNDAKMWALIDGTTAPLMQVPSGLALRDGTIYISDNRASLIFAFNLEGQLLDYLDMSTYVAPNSLQGLDLDPQGRIYVVDSVAHKVFRIEAKPESSN